MADLDRTAAGVQSQVAADGSYLNGASAGLGIRTPANVVQVHATATGFGIDAARNSRGVDRTTRGLELDPSHLPRNVDGELAGKMPWRLALPVGHNPCGIALHPCADFVGLELVLSFLFRRSAG